MCAVADTPDESLVLGKDGAIANVVIFLAKAPASVHPDLKEAPKTPVVFDQVGCRFISLTQRPFASVSPCSALTRTVQLTTSTPIRWRITARIHRSAQRQDRPCRQSGSEGIAPAEGHV